MIKKLGFMLMSIMLVLVLAACGKQTSNTSKNVGGNGGNTNEPKIAVVLKTLSNPYWAMMKEGIEMEAKAQGIKVDIFAVSSEDDFQGQMQLFEDLLNKDYDGIAFAPLSPVNLISQVANATSKGIPTVNIDEQVDMKELKSADGNIYAFVTTDNIKVGQKAAEYIVKEISGGQVAIIEGKSGNITGEARKKGAIDVFKSNSSIKLVSSQPADWDRTKALDVATNMIQRYPDLKAIYAANDTMALGALQAVKNAGKLEKIKIVGTDGMPEAVQSVKDGELAATIAQDSEKIGAESLKQLIDAVKNKVKVTSDLKAKEITVDANLVTK